MSAFATEDVSCLSAEDKSSVSAEGMASASTEGRYAFSGDDTSSFSTAEISCVETEDISSIEADAMSLPRDWIPWGYHRAWGRGVLIARSRPLHKLTPSNVCQLLSYIYDRWRWGVSRGWGVNITPVTLMLSQGR